MLGSASGSWVAPSFFPDWFPGQDLGTHLWHSLCSHSPETCFLVSGVLPAFCASGDRLYFCIRGPVKLTAYQDDSDLLLHHHSCHLLSTCSWPGSGLSACYPLSHLIQSQPWEAGTVTIPSVQMGNRGQERGSPLPKMTQPVSDKARIQDPGLWSLNKVNGWYQCKFPSRMIELYS